jgi:hypothetical protein
MKTGKSPLKSSFKKGKGPEKDTIFSVEETLGDKKPKSALYFNR